MKGMKLISESLPKATEKVFTRKYIMLGRLLTRWEDIVGQAFYAKTQPVKIRYFKTKTRSKTAKSKVLLEIASSTADATVLHYQKDLILERINQIFGDGFVDDIKFVPANGSEQLSRGKTGRHSKKPPKTITHDEKARLEELLNSVEDEEIKKRLQNLGTSILQKPS